ncbi:MAG: magnesium/cobalt transporter CorA [Deltaproteobacteria bacterium]|nr:magnesium/cobalt transporter CorA [Deltaproteobacteria bacterium]
MIRILLHRQGEATVREASRPELPALLADERAWLWIDVEAPTDDESALLTDPLNLHPVVVGTCREPSSSARIQDLDDHLLLTVHEARLPAKPTVDPFETAEIDVVLGRRFLLTYHEEPVDCVKQVRELLGRSARPFARGPALLLHELLDRLVDAYGPVMDRFNDEIEGLEEEVVGRPDRRTLETILTLKRSLQRIRRASARHKEILLALWRDELDLVPAELQPYFRNVHDHLTRVADLAESYRDLLGGVLDAYLSTASNRLNEVMKFLTLITTVMMPMTCIAGVYGMNFDREQAGNMPELGWPYGYLFALGLMALVGVGMLLYFRIRRWL